jgi:hypothetical protein
MIAIELSSSPPTAKEHPSGEKQRDQTHKLRPGKGNLRLPSS